MKILKLLIFIILGLVLLFFAIGLFKPSVGYGHEILTNKSIKESWAVLQDESKYPLWLEGFKSMELISGEKGKVGSKYKIIINPGNGQQDFEMVETVVSLKEYERGGMRFDSDVMKFDQIITLNEKDGKTAIKTENKVTGHGIMMRSMFALMEMIGNSFTAQETKNLEALKKVIDENTKDYYPSPEPLEIE